MLPECIVLREDWNSVRTQDSRQSAMAERNQWPQGEQFRVLSPNTGQKMGLGLS